MTRSDRFVTLKMMKTRVAIFLGVGFGIFAALGLWLGGVVETRAGEFVSLEVEAQPLGANVSRLLEAFDYLGANPFSAEEVAAIREAIGKRDAEAIQRTLHPHVLFEIHRTR